MQIFRLFRRYLLLLLLVLPALLSIASPGTSPGVAYAADEVEDEEIEDDGQVENDDAEETPPPSKTVIPTDSEDDEAKPLKASPDADTVILFTNPTVPADLPAGKVVDFLVGFTNKGKQDFLVEAMDASFRYPMDFSFYIQNFTTIPYHRTVKP